MAFYQSITVREYLAALIGKPLPPYVDPSTGLESYDANLDPTIDLLYGIFTLFLS